MSGGRRGPSAAGPGLLGPYQQFKADARGWGVPSFKDFRERLWPLRRLRDFGAWPEGDAVFVLELAEAGAGAALRRVFGSNPAAARLLRAARLEPEPLPRGEVEAHMRALLRRCRAAGWAANDYLALLAHLEAPPAPAGGGEEGARGPHPLAGARGAGGADGLGGGPAVPGADEDLFAAAFRGAGEGYRRLVREMLVFEAQGAAVKAVAADARRKKAGDP